MTDPTPAPVDITDASHPAWAAVVDIAPLEAVVAAVRAPDPEWAVCNLINASVIAAVRAVTP